MSTPVRRTVLAVSIVAVLATVVGLARRARSTAIPQAVTVTLPLRCRLAGHGWKRPKPGALPARRTCKRCEALELPTP